MASSLSIFFRIVYATFYSFLHLLLVALLLVSPGDIINQSRLRHNIYPILIVSACYVAGVLIVIFISLLRLYLTRSVLNSIPKSWIPIEKSDLKKHVRKMIHAGLSRSAAISLVSRPRTAPSQLLCSPLPPPPPALQQQQHPSLAGPRVAADDGYADADADADAASREPRRAGRLADVKKTGAVEREMGIDLPAYRPVWGEIEHAGWAPPDATGTSNVQYSAVVAEVPNLIEAKALTLAPPPSHAPLYDRAAEPTALALDPDAVAMLQRPVSLGLRGYLAHLSRLQIIDVNGRVSAGDGDADAGADGRPLSAVLSSLIDAYEYARYSTRAISYTNFAQLMHDLAIILRHMAPLDPNRLVAARDSDYDSSLGDRRSSIDRTLSLRSKADSTDDAAGSSGSSDDAGSISSASIGGLGRQAHEQSRLRVDRRRILPRRRPPLRAASSPLFYAASARRGHGASSAGAENVGADAAASFANSRSSSANTFAQSRRPYPTSQASSSSLRSAASSGSVIRLAESGDPPGLPYVLLPRPNFRPLAPTDVG